MSIKSDSISNDIFWMRRALELATQAESQLEVPVGAVLVGPEGLVAEAFNLRETMQSPLGHAEIFAIAEASKKLGRWRLHDLSLYVTLEPCAMCSGALVQARIPRLIYGASDPKAGCAGSVLDIVRNQSFNHRMDVTNGVLAEECSQILSRFFQRLRT